VNTVLDGERPAAVAIPGWSETYALAAIAWCGRTRTPCVLMSESTEHDEPRQIWREHIKRRVVRHFSAALAGGSSHGAYLERLGLPSGRIRIGYDVVDNDYFRSGAAAARRDRSAVLHQMALPDKYFLASARFVHKKNLLTLLDAYAAYRDARGGQSWKLVILGDGPLRQEIVERATRLTIEDDVLLPGFMQYGQLPLYYGLAQAFLHTSSSEPWGLVVNEAMACGLPVIVSRRCGCAPDLVIPGKNGFQFDPADMRSLAELMTEVASDRCDRNAMGSASLEIISRYSPELFAEGLRDTVAIATTAPVPKRRLTDAALLQVLARR
jgi:glycosyltransferase involved in cell wall biosynthesis